MATTTEHANALTFDLDWAPDGHAGPGCAHGAGIDDALALLDLLALHGLRATLFVPGPLARRHPALMRHIVAAGHELASRGYACAGTQTRFQFRRDLLRSKGVLEDSSGCAVLGYRAPLCAPSGAPGSTSGRADHPGADHRATDHRATDHWAADLLYQHGFRYRVASLAPSRAGAGPRAPVYPSGWPGLLDLPLAALRLGPCTLPWRASPAWLARPLLRLINDSAPVPAVVRLLPAPLQARPAGLAALARAARWDRVDRLFPVLP